MKLNKGKNKGKVHPSPSLSSSSSSSSSNDQILTHLLPTAILTLISVLSLQDREALAYLITHSLKSSSNPFSSFDQKLTPKKKSSSTTTTGTNNHSHNSITAGNHKSPCFDCFCFDCFSSFWNRWDSSPHRELIDQAIEAFEEHLASTEKHKPKSKNNNNNNNSAKNGGNKRREKTVKMGCSAAADVEERELSTGSHPQPEQEEVAAMVVGEVEERESGTPETSGLGDVEERENEDWFTVTTTTGEVVGGGGADGDDVEERESGGHQKKLQQQQHKGLARKVLPDVIGLFNSRLWNLWGPNV